jgi:hypothetical protein
VTLTAKNLRRLLGPALLLAYLSAFFSTLSAGPRGLTERDGYFHARYAQMLPHRGLSRSFPWTQASPWKDRFADKEFLFHVLLVPFSIGENPIRGALFFGLLQTLGVFAAFYLLLSLNGARAPAFFTFLLTCMGGPFLLRISFLRPHVLSVLLILVALHFLIRDKWKPLAVLGFLYSWTYSFPFILPLIAAPFVLGRLWARPDGTPDMRCLWAALGGVAAGLLVHPYAPYSLDSAATYFDILAVALGRRSAAAVEVGREFAPYSTRSFLIGFPLLSLIAAGLGLAGWRTTRKPEPETVALLCVAACSILGTMVYMRSIEYAAPLTAAALAFAVRDWLKAPNADRLQKEFQKRPRKMRCWAAGAALILLFAHLDGAAYAFRLSSDNEPPRFKKAAQWMSEHLTAGETVVNLWWDDFPDLFYSGYRQRYIVGLDPTYLLKFDRQTALKLSAMRTGRAPIDAPWLAKRFSARYMILRRRHAMYYPQLSTRAWRPTYQDEYAAIYALTGPHGPPKELLGLPQIPSLP